MSLILEGIIAGISLIGVCTTALINGVELFLEHRKGQQREQAVNQIVEIKNVMKSLTPPNSDNSD